MIRKEKKIMTLNEINAYKVAYGNPLMKKEVFTALVLPFMIGFFSLLVLTYYIWLAIIGGLACAIYGYVVLMRDSVKRVYKQQALLQRNKFVNNLSGIIIDKKSPIIYGLKWCAQPTIAKGKFKKDLDRLIVDLMDANPDEVKKAYDKFSEKHKSDYPFSLFIESLVTASLEGRTDIEAIKEAKSWHNDMLEVTNNYIESKVGHMKDFKTMTLFIVGVIVILTFSMGFKSYLLYYAHNPIGWVFSLILVCILGYHFHTFQKKLVDDEVLEVKIWKRK